MWNDVCELENYHLTSFVFAHFNILHIVILFLCLYGGWDTEFSAVFCLLTSKKDVTELSNLRCCLKFRWQHQTFANYFKALTKYVFQFARKQKTILQDCYSLTLNKMKVFWAPFNPLASMPPAFQFPVPLITTRKNLYEDNCLHYPSLKTLWFSHCSMFLENHYTNPNQCFEHIFRGL